MPSSSPSRQANPVFEKASTCCINWTDTPGRHLVVLRYKPNHNPPDEWVYNDADIDASRVVWARSMGAEKDRRLLEYFSSRRAWRLYADERPPRLVPYDTGAAVSREHSIATR
jgi:hypothetical protein